MPRLSVSNRAITEGSKKEALERIRQLGANNIIIRSVKPTEAGGGEETTATAAAQTSRVLEYGLKHKDLERLKEEAAREQAVSATAV